MKRVAFIIVAACFIAATFTSCTKDDPTPEDTTETNDQNNGNNENNQGNSGNQTASLPDCFVYYKGAQFVFKTSFDDGTSKKITWEVTDYNSSTSTATISVKNGDNDPYETHLRKGSKCIEFGGNGSWKALSDGGSNIEFMNGSELYSIPSGIYGSVTDKTTVGSVSIPGGKTSTGFTISSSYQPTTGYHDSFLFDYSSSESWSTECGFVSDSYFYQNGKEYPIFTQRTNTELVAYQIPMPDGSTRSYIPAGSEAYDVTDTYFSCYQNDYKTQRYACIFSYWNDNRNKNVLRYQLCLLWYDNGWQYAQLTESYNNQWKMSGWFAGEKYSESAIGGAMNGVSFDCAGHYSSRSGSQSYSPFGDAGYYTFFVLVENSVNVGVPDTEKTVFSLLYIPNDGSAASTYSQRVSLKDDGTVDAYSASTSSTKSAISGVRPNVPTPDMIIGPIRKLDL